MSKHTPEPWHVGGMLDAIVYDPDGNAVGNTITHHGRHGIEAGVNARRIVACVNACAGIDTDWLEANQKRIAPSGWAIVPIEPTQDMIRASCVGAPMPASTWGKMVMAAPAQKPNLGPNASLLLHNLDAIRSEYAILQEHHIAALADIATAVAAYNESKSSPMTTKLRLAIENLERGFARAEVQS